jgi:hypothetical protein
MPSLSYTPGALVLTGGEFNPVPVRFSYAAGLLRLTGANYTVGPNLSTDLTDDIAAILDTLFAGEAIVDEKGRPTRRFQQIFQNTIEGIKAILTSQGSSINELQRIYAGINAAQSTAAQAVQTAQTVQAAIDLSGSFIAPVGALTASSAGSITIAAHTRHYADGTTVAVDGGSVSGFASGAYVTVYYLDPARTGGAVSYVGTTDAVSQTGNTHIVGQVTIPGVGEADVPGAGPTAPGYVPPDTFEYDPRLIEYYEYITP